MKLTRTFSVFYKIIVPIKYKFNKVTILTACNNYKFKC